jgi:dextranase
MNVSDSSLKLLDFYPTRGVYKPGEMVRCILKCEATQAANVAFTLTLFHGPNAIKTSREIRSLDAGPNLVDFSLLPLLDAPAGYGIALTCADGMAVPSKIQTAFDVLPNWTMFPRYGYLTDFSFSRPDEKATMQILAKFHINGLQFYDWQYRHDQLVAPSTDYLDPLGRSLSLATLERLIDAAHAHGIAAMPYLAVYAASAIFWRAHPDWMLYDDEHQPIPFGEDFLGIMNPTGGSPWQKHLLDECSRVLKALPFDGLHIDQYGDPKSGFDQNHQPVDIARSFGYFIQAASDKHPEIPILFNAVGNWPIETLAASPVAFNYIEIWPPDIHYTDLARIVRNARKLSAEKPVVIALYMPAVREINHLLADAVILSAGGNRIEIGENARLLTDPYFPKHESISDALMAALRTCADFSIRYEEWVGPLVPESAGPKITLPVVVEGFYRKVTGGASLSLVNLKSDVQLCWNEAHDSPEVFNSFTLEIPLEFTPQKVWLIEPYASAEPQLLAHQINEDKVSVLVPNLEVWTVLLFEK